MGGKNRQFAHTIANIFGKVIIFVTFEYGLRLVCWNKKLTNVSIYSKPGCYPSLIDVENHGTGLSFPHDVAEAKYIRQSGV